MEWVRDDNVLGFEEDLDSYFYFLQEAKIGVIVLMSCCIRYFFFFVQREFMNMIFTG